MWAGHTCGDCDHSVLSSFGHPWQSDLTGCIEVPGSCFFSATGLPVTSTTFPVSDSGKGPHLLIFFAATSLPVADHQPTQTLHFAVALEKSTLRRILNFFSSCSQVFPTAMGIPGPLDAVRLFADEELFGT